MRRGLKLRQLRLLIALDAHRNVRRAASALHLTQPALSRALLDLEQGLGLALFLRTPRGLEPTEAGATLVRYAHAIEKDLERATLALESSGANDAWRLAVGVMHGASPVVFPAMQRIRAMRAEAPFSLSVHEGTVDVLVSLLRASRIDVAIGVPTEAGTIADLSVTPLYADPVVWVVARGHPIARRKRVGLQDLLDLVWILPPRVSRLRGVVDAALRAHRIAPPDRLIGTLSHETILSFLAQGDAVALVTSQVARRFEARGLVHALDIEMSHVLRVAAMTRADTEPHAAASEFIACLVEPATGLATEHATRRRAR